MSEKNNEMFEQMSAMMSNMMPRVTASKNGYEIRTKVLDLAVMQAWQDYNAKWGQFETSVAKEDDEIITKVTTGDAPSIPNADFVLEIAEKFYGFINQRK